MGLTHREQVWAMDIHAAKHKSSADMALVPVCVAGCEERADTARQGMVLALKSTGGELHRNCTACRAPAGGSGLPEEVGLEQGHSCDYSRLPARGVSVQIQG